MSALLKRLEKAADKLDRVRSAAEDAVCKAAWDYVTEQVIAYSLAHPRRLVTFCSAMGTATLHVQKGGWAGRTKGIHNEYQFGTMYGEKNWPEFMQELDRIATDTGLEWAMTGSRNLEVKGGVVIKDLTHW